MAVLSKTQPLEDRIRSLQAEASAGIDKFVAMEMEELCKGSNTGECGIPEAAIRQGLMRGSFDVCEVYLRLKKRFDDAAALKGKAA